MLYNFSCWAFKNYNMAMREYRSTTYSLFVWLCFFIAVACYLSLASGGIPFIGILVLSSMFITFFFAGDSFVRITSNYTPHFNSIPTRLLIGTLLCNVALYLTALILPFSLATTWLVIMVIALSIWSVTKAKFKGNAPRTTNQADLIFTLVATVSVMIWCLEILRPIEIKGSIAILRAWPDVYYHMSQIGSLARSTGLTSMQDLQMAGAPIHPYHLASYIFPALIQQLAGISQWAAFSGFLVPFGFLLTACAAFSLTLSIFGKWPAVAAGLSVLLIPDAAQQGFGNQYVGGYYWLQLIAPGGMYGVTSAAVVFLFLFEARRTNRLAFVAMAYFFVLATLMFKAQIFVAISFLAFLFPVLFMGGIKPWWRTILFSLLTFIYFVVLDISQTSTSMPVIRLDGSGLEVYSSWVMGSQSDGIIKKLWLSSNTATIRHWLPQAFIFTPILTVTTFGVITPLYLFFFLRIKRACGPIVAYFPILVVIIYLVMATRLSLDTRRIGTPEELLHRPFVWAYFIMLTWTTASAYRCFVGDQAPRSTRGKYMMASLFACLLAIPIFNHKDIQTYKLWGINHQKLPACVIKVADFIRANSAPHDVIQDSLNDRHFTLSALSARQSFAIDTGGIRTPAGVDTRLASLAMIKNLRSPSQIEIFMRENNIAYYVANPSDSIAWLNIMNDHKVFQCDQFSVFRF